MTKTPSNASTPSAPPAREIDHVIIGAGPVGLEIAIAMKRAGLEYVQIESGQIGQQIYEFPPLTPFFSSNDRISIAGVPIPSATQAKCRREEYLAYLRAVAEQFDLDVNTYERVIGADRISDGFELTTRTSSGEERRYRTRNVILVTGGTAYHRTLDIPGEQLPHVTHDLGEVHQYWRRKVLIVGGRNSAAEAALRCYHAGARVTICHRGEAMSDRVKYWLKPELEMLMHTGRIDGRFRVQPVRITPTHVTLRSLDDGSETDVEAEHVLLMIGYRADMSLCRMLGVNLQGEQEIPEFDEQTMRTNVPGVYVAGTASAGTQVRFAVYIENSHIHADRIVRSLQGQSPPLPPKPLVQAET